MLILTPVSLTGLLFCFIWQLPTVDDNFTLSMCILIISHKKTAACQTKYRLV